MEQFYTDFKKEHKIDFDDIHLTSETSDTTVIIDEAQNLYLNEF